MFDQTDLDKITKVLVHIATLTLQNSTAISSNTQAITGNVQAITHNIQAIARLTDIINQLHDNLQKAQQATDKLLELIQLRDAARLKASPNGTHPSC